MTISFKDIPENKRYGYCQVSSKEQARNSSLDIQKFELIRTGVLEQNSNFYEFINFLILKSKN